MHSLGDRRALVEIEQQLRTSTPDLARRLERFDAWAPPRTRHRDIRRAVRLAVLVSGAVLLVVAFIVSSADAAVLAVVLLLADATWWGLSAVLRRLRRSASGHRNR